MSSVVRRVPLTSTGWVLAGLGPVAYLGGWLLGWVELMVIAAGALLALLVAAPFVVGRLRLQVERALHPDRVMVGEPALAVLTVTNDSQGRVPARIVEDQIRGGRMQVEVPSLAGGASHEAVYNLPTSRRGRIEVGPAVIVKADPLGLMRREVVQTRPHTLWVHPRHRAVAPLPVGFAKDLEGPTSDTSPQGDVAFHALREYQVGDDYRHIHWLSTARVGTVMVRHYVDNRRPQLGVVLDDRAEIWHGDTFEVAVEVAASLAVTSVVHRQPVSVHHGGTALLGRTVPGAVDDLLDRLATVEPGTGVSPSDAVGAMLRAEPGTSATALVTAGVDPASLVPVVQAARRRGRVIVVRVLLAGRSDPAVLPGARLLDVSSLDELAAAWEAIAA